MLYKESSDPSFLNSYQNPLLSFCFPFYALATRMSVHVIANENGKLGETNYIKTEVVIVESKNAK